MKYAPFHQETFQFHQFYPNPIFVLPIINSGGTPYHVLPQMTKHLSQI